MISNPNIQIYLRVVRSVCWLKTKNVNGIKEYISR